MWRQHPTAARGLLAALVVVAALLLLSGPAAADVQVSAPDAASGARDVRITFRVTNDDPAVPTTRLQVFLPTARPLLGVEPTAPAGWTARLTTAAPPGPVRSDDLPVDEIVTTVEWVGGTVNGTDDAVFPIEVDRLPTGAGPLRFRVVQTYAGGATVEWSDTAAAGVPAPAHPSLVVRYAGVSALPAESGHHHAATAQDQAIAAGGGGSAWWTLGFAAALAAVVAAGSIALGRRQRRRLTAVWAAEPRAATSPLTSPPRGGAPVPPEPEPEPERSQSRRS